MACSGPTHSCRAAGEEISSLRAEIDTINDLMRHMTLEKKAMEAAAASQSKSAAESAAVSENLATASKAAAEREQSLRIELVEARGEARAARCQLEAVEGRFQSASLELKEALQQRNDYQAELTSLKVNEHSRTKTNHTKRLKTICYKKFHLLPVFGHVLLAEYSQAYPSPARKSPARINEQREMCVYSCKQKLHSGTAELIKRNASCTKMLDFPLVCDLISAVAATRSLYCCRSRCQAPT